MKNKQYLLRGLFSRLLVGFLSCTGFLQVSLMADDAQEASPKISEEGGRSVQIKPDGTKIIQDSDGSIIQIESDGTKRIKKPDGSSIQINPDGTKVIQNADGSKIQIKPGS